MYDVKDILAAALDRGPGPGQPVNPAGDLARGAGCCAGAG